MNRARQLHEYFLCAQAGYVWRGASLKLKRQKRAPTLRARSKQTFRKAARNHSMKLELGTCTR